MSRVPDRDERVVDGEGPEPERQRPRDDHRQEREDARKDVPLRRRASRRRARYQCRRDLSNLRHRLLKTTSIDSALPRIRSLALRNAGSTARTPATTRTMRSFEIFVAPHPSAVDAFGSAPNVPEAKGSPYAEGAPALSGASMKRRTRPARDVLDIFIGGAN